MKSKHVKFSVKFHIFVCSGAERLICHLYTNNIPICVATSSTAESFKIKTKKHAAIFKMFNFIVTGGSDKEVKRGKPYPDIFLIAASRFKDKPKPENVTKNVTKMLKFD
mgnify:FL=1